MKYKHGWNPDIPDIRDYKYRLGTTTKRSVDLSSFCSEIEDQKSLGSCTANALVGAMEFLEKSASFCNLSRLFVYYYERLLEGTVNYDAGASLRDGIKVLAKQGVCPESDWPYLIKSFRKAPTKKCIVEALSRKIVQYNRLSTVDDMRHCLVCGYPFVFGFAVYESFESTLVAKTGIVKLPVAGEKSLGGHAVMAVGYDDSAQRFKVRNSWGKGWGKHGYFTIPYEYLADRNLSDDFWQIVR